MEVKNHNFLEQMMCKELDILEKKYTNKPEEMTIQDLEKIDKLYHALKSKATYEAMKEAEEEYEYGDGYSGRRGRSMTTGRYISRDSGNNSYADGYARGYSEAMNQNATFRPRY